MLNRRLLPALFMTLALSCALLVAFANLLAWGNDGSTDLNRVTTLSSTVVTTTIAPEIYGLAGPNPVNCSDTIYLAAKTALDQQRADWVAATAATLPGVVALPAWISGPSGTAVSVPYSITQPDGFVMTITPVDLAPAWGFQSGSAATGVPAYDSVQINGSPSGCTMQDNAPKPSAATGGDYYFNQLSNARGLNGLLLTFSTPVQAFGAFFGDVETSYRGTTAFLRLLDAGGALVADLPISSTLGINGGVSAENAICDQSNAPNVHVAAQGLTPGCGNGSTRWIGFRSDTPIAKALVVVGDNDPLPEGRGLTEKLSIMGATVLRTLSPTEVTIGKSAPAVVTAGTPFQYTLVVTNSSSTFAAGIVVTDAAPAGITFHAVSGAGCILAAGVVTCHLHTLAAGASATMLVQATASLTTTITNAAFVTATNDSDGTNNQASTTITPAAAPPVNYCATPLPSGGPVLVINEVLYNEIGSNGDEWVELYATTNIPAGTQFFLSDNESGSGGFNRLITAPNGGILAGTYLLVHDDANAAGDDLDPSDGLIDLWSAGTSPTSTSLRNSGDNLTLYSGGSAVDANAIDYMRYDDDEITDSTNDPPPATVLWSGFATDRADNAQSVARIVNGHDGNSGADWALAGTSATVGSATPGANNNGLTACNVAIAKTGPTTVAVGAPFAYALTVRNTTGVTITGVTITDTQPSGVIFAAVTGNGCNLTSGAFTCTVGTLLPNATAVVTVTATANSAQTITNTAYTRAISDAILSDNEANHAITFRALGSIGDFVYLDANRNGTQDADEQTPLNGVVVTLRGPNGFVTTTQSIDGLYLFPHLPAALYTVTVGSAASYELTSVSSYTVNLTAGQLYTQADFGFAYATSSVHVTKTGATTAVVGDIVVYTLTVVNDSTTTPALGAVLTDTLPAGLTNAQVADVRCAIIAIDLLCNLDAIAPQATTTITVTVTAATVGNWLNQVVIAADNDANAIDNSAALTTVIIAPTPTPTTTPTPTATHIATSTPVATHTATTTSTPAATPFTTLGLTSVCSDEPTQTRRWRVRNNNPFPVDFTYLLNGSNPLQSGIYTAPANSDFFFETITISGANVLIIRVNGVQQSVKASGGARCATPTPTATSTPTVTETPLPTPTPTDTLLPTATNTATVTATPTATDTITPTATMTDTPEPTATATPTNSASPTATTTPSVTATDTAEPTVTATLEPTTTATATDEPTPTASPTLTDTPTATLTATATPSPTATDTGTATPSVTPTVAVTPMPEPTVTATDPAEPTATASSTVTEMPSATSTATPTTTATETPVPPTATSTATDTPTVTPTETAMATAEPTATVTPFPTEANTATPTLEPTATVTATVTDEPTATASPTLTETPSATSTATLSPTATATVTATPSATPTPKPTATVTATPTDTAEPTVTPTLEPTVTATATATGEPTATASPTMTEAPMATSTSTPSPTTTDTVTATPLATPTVTATSSLAPTPTREPTATATVPATATAEPTITDTPTMTATATPTATSVATMTTTATATLTPTATAAATSTPPSTVTATETATPTPTVTATAAPTSAPTLTPTLTRTATPAPTITATVTVTPTLTPTATSTATETATTMLPTTPTITDTPEPTTTPTPIPTLTPTATPEATATATVTLTVTAQPTVTPTATSTTADRATPTVTATDTPSPTATVTPTDTPAPTTTPTPTATHIATATPTATLVPTTMPTSTATITPEPTATITPTATPEPTTPPVVTNTATTTTTDTPAPTATATPTNILEPPLTTTPTATALPVSTATSPLTATPTPTPTATVTVPPTVTPLPTITETATGTPTLTPAPTAIPTATPTVTVTVTPASTSTAPPTVIATTTPTPTVTATVTPAPTATVTMTTTPEPTPTTTAMATVTVTRQPTTTSPSTPTVAPSPSVTSTPTATTTLTPSVTSTSTSALTPTTTAPPLVTHPATATASTTAIPTATPTSSPTDVPPPLPPADLVLVKSASLMFVEPGGTITYTLVYSNVGFVAAQEVMITEAVPAHTSFLRTHSTPGWDCPAGTNAGARCYFALAQVAPQQRGELLYVVQVDDNLAAAVQIDNVALIGSTMGTLEPRLENNSDALMINVIIPSALEEEAEPNRTVNWIFLPIIAR